MGRRTVLGTGAGSCEQPRNEKVRTHYQVLQSKCEDTQSWGQASGSCEQPRNEKVRTHYQVLQSKCEDIGSGTSSWA